MKITLDIDTDRFDPCPIFDDCRGYGHRYLSAWWLWFYVEIRIGEEDLSK